MNLFYDLLMVQITDLILRSKTKDRCCIDHSEDHKMRSEHITNISQKYIPPQRDVPDPSGDSSFEGGRCLCSGIGKL